MAHLVEDITKYFTFEDIDIDNWHFKLYSKGCVIIFFAGSMVGVLSQYFGEPIQCDFKGVDGETAKDYCWIHGSSYIPPHYQRHMKCIADMEGVYKKEDAPGELPHSTHISLWSILQTLPIISGWSS